MLKDINAAIQKKQVMIVHLNNGEILEGIPHSCTDRLKMWSVYGAVWVPLEEIKHVCRLIQFEPKRDLTTV